MNIKNGEIGSHLAGSILKNSEENENVLDQESKSLRLKQQNERSETENHEQSINQIVSNLVSITVTPRKNLELNQNNSDFKNVLEQVKQVENNRNGGLTLEQ